MLFFDSSRRLLSDSASRRRARSSALSLRVPSRMMMASNSASVSASAPFARSRSRGRSSGGSSLIVSRRGSGGLVRASYFSTRPPRESEACSGRVLHAHPPGLAAGPASATGDSASAVPTISSGSSEMIISERSAGGCKPSRIVFRSIQSRRPCQYSFPTRTTGKCGWPAGLDQHQRLEQFVERAVSAREDHERERVIEEHVLAREEVPEMQQFRDVRDSASARWAGQCSGRWRRRRPRTRRGWPPP